MSEFSDSFHLRTTNPVDAEALLKRASVHGAILLPTEGPFVTFLVAAEDDPKVVAHNAGQLIRYWFAEDYGCWIYVYDGAQRIAELIYEDETAKEELPEDEPAEERQDRSQALDALLRAGLIDAAAADALRTLDGQGSPMEWGPRAAALLGIKPVAWLSGEDLARKEQLLAAFPGARIIDAP